MRVNYRNRRESGSRRVNSTARIECEINIEGERARLGGISAGNRADGNYHACNDRAGLNDRRISGATVGIDRSGERQRHVGRQKRTATEARRAAAARASRKDEID